jgi:hypothetical protein
LEADAQNTEGDIPYSGDEAPFSPTIHVSATNGVVLETTAAITQNGQDLYYVPDPQRPGDAKNLGAADGFFSYNLFDPGSFGFEVRRTGIQNTGIITLKKAFNIIARAQSDPYRRPPPPPPPPPPAKPTISNVVNKGAGNFEVKGSGFLKSHAVHLRVVNDATFASNSYTGSSDGSGSLDMMITIPGLSSGTLLDFSANDERPDPSDITGTLWSNTFKITV